MLQSLCDRNTLLLLACSFLLQSDQNLLAPHLSTVAHEFGMNDIERDERLGGELAMGLFLLGAPAALAIGACADRYPRKLLLVIILLVGGAAGELAEEPGDLLLEHREGVDEILEDLSSFDHVIDWKLPCRPGIDSAKGVPVD